LVERRTPNPDVVGSTPAGPDKNNGQFGRNDREPEMAQEKEKVNYVLVIRTFFNEVYVESKKIAWPSTETMVQSTSLVVLVIVILSAFMLLADFGLNSFFKIIE
jgi:preprotein translocase subunit SecE